MKRRELVKYFCLSLLGQFVFWESKTFKRIVRKKFVYLTENNTKEKIKNVDEVYLPNNPKPISTYYFLEVNQNEIVKLTSNDKLIHGQKKSITLSTPGTYSVQFLGNDLGWNILS